MSEQDSSTDQKAQPVQTPTKASSSPPASNDALLCQWNSCGERLGSAEELYDHVCERHVGRKSTNNLSLTCQWGNCRTTTVKRDHITSHIRVHVPLKPHKCDFCGKAFKRPQDLKKHVKTHADDSVLINSPEPSRSMHPSTNSSYATSAGKLVADLQSLAASANGYYPDTHQMSTAPSYYANAAVNHSGYHGGAVPAHGSAYGPVYYAVPQTTQNSNAEYELRKRAAFDALNEFFGDAKRRVIDPSTYYDVGQRLASLNTLPMLNGYSSAGMSDHHYTSTAGVHTATQPLLQQQYSLPLPNLRTKTDLLNIDQFLDQLQSTVYENPNQAAAAGVAQAGTHYVPTASSYRSSHSPPSLSTATAHTAVTPGATSTGNETPALTPASSVLSYPCAHSPSSVHSAQTISPVSRSSIGAMYPTLPSVSTMSDFTGFTPTSGAPASGLASAFDADGRRRYSSGHLHKAKPASDDGRSPTPIQNTPTLKVEDTDAAKLPEVGKLGINSPATKHAELEQPSSPGSTDEADRANEAWVENIRIIEALRSFIKEKLDKGDFESDKSAASKTTETAAARSPSTEPMEGVEKSSPAPQREAESLYPSLKELTESA